jgi:hypothetical protein
MKKKLHHFIGLVMICMLAPVDVSAIAAARQPRSSYPRMASLSQHLMISRAEELALARSAMPAAISDGATLLVLKPHGYVTAIDGNNVFVCVVERRRPANGSTVPPRRACRRGSAESAPGSNGTGLLFSRQRNPHVGHT